MVATLIVCVTLLVLAERLRPLAVRLVDHRTQRPTEPLEVAPSFPPLPEDLAARLDACREGWERSDLLGAIREHYLEARAIVASEEEAWVAVRQRLRAGE